MTFKLLAVTFLLVVAVPALGQGSLPVTNTDSTKSSYSYTPSNKRDPFQPPLKLDDSIDESLPNIQRYTLEQLQLTTILWNGSSSDSPSRAMFKDPKNKIHILAEGDKIGKNFGVIFKINPSEVIVAEKFTDPYGKESIQETTLVIRDRKKK